jgi:SAM-dependent methyltransferase
MADPVRDFYTRHPRMVSSPFGGVDGIDAGALRATLDRLGLALDGRRVLDVGCGRGYAATLVEAAGGRYIGADFVVSRAGFALAQADAARLPFPDAAFDLLFCIDASEHFPDPAAAAREFHRVLRPGGALFLSAPNYANVAGLVKCWCEWRGTYARDTWAPFGRWQPQELEQPLTPRFIRRTYRDAGFARCRAVAHPPEVLLGLLPWADHPRAPDALRFRLQRAFRLLGPPIARCWPAASLHLFWRIDKA